MEVRRMRLAAVAGNARATGTACDVHDKEWEAEPSRASDQHQEDRTALALSFMVLGVAIHGVTALPRAPHRSHKGSCLYV